jgi:hypothetical protein
MYKFFYEDEYTGDYGEFYIDIVPAKAGAMVGTAELKRKDPSYARVLLEALGEELEYLQDINPDKIEVNLSTEGLREPSY